MHGKEILDIRTVPGRKAINDKKILVEGKPLSIKDLCHLVRLMANNERAINGDKIARNNRFFFAEAIEKALHTQESVDTILQNTLVPDKNESLFI